MRNVKILGRFCRLGTYKTNRNFHYLPKMSDTISSSQSPNSPSSDSSELTESENDCLVEVLEENIVYRNAVEQMRGSMRSGSLGMDVDTMGLYLANKLGIGGPQLTQEIPEKVLDEVTLDGIIKWIEGEQCHNIITLAGAGISTSAGIPDFRSPETGLYHNLQKYNLPEPQYIFEINFFKHNPKPFFTLAKELFPGKFKPTVSHYFIKLLHDKGLLLRHYTQNIDMLDRSVGIPEDKLVEAHGTLYTSHCLDCQKEYSLEFMKERIFADEIPICTECPGVVKPDIVFYGQGMPSKFRDLIHEDFPKCDLLIIMGTSLEVRPFASLIDFVPNWCPRLLINREKAGVKYPPWMFRGGVGGEGLYLEDDSIRDVARLGDCDEGCQELAQKLGWAEELNALVAGEPAPLKHDAPVVVAPVAPIAPIAPIAPLAPASPQEPTEDPVPGFSSSSTSTSESFDMRNKGIIYY